MAVLIAATALAVGCRRAPELPPAVALWNGGEVRVPEMVAELERARRELRPRGENAGDVAVVTSEQLPVFRRTVLAQVVERKLLSAAAKQAGVSIGDRDLEDALRAHQSSTLTDEAKPAVLDAAAKQRLNEDLVIDRFLVRTVAARVAISPDEVKAYYDAHPDEFQRSEQVRCSQITVAKREEAEALAVQLRRGADFAAVAREQSMTDDKVRGGDLGWFGKGRMPPAFEKACFELRRGRVSEVVETEYGFHLFKLVDRREARRLPLPDVEARIELNLRRQRVAEAQKALVEKLRAEVGVQLFEAELEKLP